MGASCMLGSSYVGPARKSSPFGHIHSNKSFNDQKLVHSKWLYVGFIFVYETKSKSIGRYKSQPGSTPGGGGYSHTLPIRVCAAQRGRDFEASGLERGIHFRRGF